MIETENQDNLDSLLENYGKQKEINTAVDWEKVHKRITHFERRRICFNFIRNTAAIILPLFLTYQYVIEPMLSGKRTKEDLITICSAPGLVTKTILPDGSEVWLNAQSTLTYPREFHQKERTVMLTGEAYFNVSSDKRHRFNVRIPQKMVVSAYGTKFNVNAYATDRNYEVTLAEGHVEVSSDMGIQARKALVADEKAVLNASTGGIDVAVADTYVETAWKEGKMVFRREKLDKITEKLSRKFGVTIRLEGDKLKEYEYTATFTDETLDDILDLLTRSAPITYRITKQKQLEDKTFTQREIIIQTM